MSPRPADSIALQTLATLHVFHVMACSTGDCRVAWPPIASSGFSRSLVSPRWASPQIDEAAHAESVGDLPQALEVPARTRPKSRP